MRRLLVALTLGALSASSSACSDSSDDAAGAGASGGGGSGASGATGGGGDGATASSGGPGTGAQGSGGEATGGGGGAPAVTPHVLYVTHSAGFVHAVLPHSVEVLQSLANETGDFTLAHYDDANAALAEDVLAGAQGLVFYTSGELPLDDAARQRLLDFVAAGNAFVGFHSASDTLYEWSAYGSLVGGYFDGHPWHEEVGLVIEEPAHPAVSALAAPLVLTDEVYQFSDWQQGSTVLLSLDTATVDLGAGGVHNEPWGFPLAWTRMHGRGRVFYTALGHGDVWDDASFQALALGGIRWATKLD